MDLVWREECANCEDQREMAVASIGRVRAARARHEGSLKLDGWRKHNGQYYCDDCYNRCEQCDNVFISEHPRKTYCQDSCRVTAHQQRTTD